MESWEVFPRIHGLLIRYSVGSLPHHKTNHSGQGHDNNDCDGPDGESVIGFTGLGAVIDIHVFSVFADECMAFEVLDCLFEHVSFLVVEDVIDEWILSSFDLRQSVTDGYLKQWSLLVGTVGCGTVSYCSDGIGEC